MTDNNIPLIFEIPKKEQVSIRGLLLATSWLCFCSLLKLPKFGQFAYYIIRNHDDSEGNFLTKALIVGYILFCELELECL